MLLVLVIIKATPVPRYLKKLNSYFIKCPPVCSNCMAAQSAALVVHPSLASPGPLVLVAAALSSSKENSSRPLLPAAPLQSTQLQNIFKLLSVIVENVINAVISVAFLAALIFYLTLPYRFK